MGLFNFKKTKSNKSKSTKNNKKAVAKAKKQPAKPNNTAKTKTTNNVKSEKPKSNKAIPKVKKQTPKPNVKKKTKNAITNTANTQVKAKSDFPEKVPFWARLKIDKNRTTLVIDRENVINKKTKKEEPGFVHREAIHTENKNYEKIVPNPDPNDKTPMYLKRPKKIPQRLVSPHNKELNMPKHLQERYEKNNNKNAQPNTEQKDK